MKRSFLAVFLFIVSGFVVYSATVRTFFLSDDFYFIYWIKTNGPLGAWCGGWWQFFRPLISLSLYADYKLWGLAPQGYHAVNILVHSLNAFLVFLTASMLFNRSGGGSLRGVPALLSGLLFLCMPVHAEAVSWISGRCDVISTFFFLASFYGYLRYREYGLRRNLAASLAFFAAALFAKESAIILPFVVLLFELFYFTGTGMRAWPRISRLFLPYFLLLLAYLPVRYAVIGRLIGGYGPGCHLNFSPGLLAGNLSMYVWRSFLGPSLGIGPAVFFVAAAAVFLFLIRRGARDGLAVIGILAAAFVIALAPVLNLGVWTGDTQGDRFMYLPSVFSSMILMAAAGLLIRRRAALVFFSSCLLAVCLIALSSINRNWDRAGRVTRQVVDAVGNAGRADTLCVLNIPDNIHGAYIFRNGLREALFLFAPDSFSKLGVCLYHNIFTQDDAVDVEAEGDMYTVRLSNPLTLFYPVKIFDREKDSCIAAGPRIRNSLRDSRAVVSLRELKEKDRLMFFTRGTLVDLGHYPRNGRNE